jgi:hypothetical protein
MVPGGFVAAECTAARTQESLLHRTVNRLPPSNDQRAYSGRSLPTPDNIRLIEQFSGSVQKDIRQVALLDQHADTSNDSERKSGSRLELHLRPARRQAFSDIHSNTQNE